VGESGSNHATFHHAVQYFALRHWVPGVLQFFQRYTRVQSATDLAVRGVTKYLFWKRYKINLAWFCGYVYRYTPVTTPLLAVCSSVCVCACVCVWLHTARFAVVRRDACHTRRRPIYVIISHRRIVSCVTDSSLFFGSCYDVWSFLRVITQQDLYKHWLPVTSAVWLSFWYIKPYLVSVLFSSFKYFLVLVLFLGEIALAQAISHIAARFP